MARVSAEQRRGELVHAALRVIERDGVYSATTRAIVAEAGMSLASFHYAYPSRDDLIRSVIAHVVAGEQQAAFAAMTDAADPRDAIRAGLHAYLDLVVEHPGREQAMFELFHYALRTPEFGGLPGEQYTAYRGLVLAVLDDTRRRSGIRFRVPLDDLARLIVTITDGVTLGWLADRDTAAARRVLDSAADLLATLAAGPNPSAEETA